MNRSQRRAAKRKTESIMRVYADQQLYLVGVRVGDQEVALAEPILANAGDLTNAFTAILKTPEEMLA